MSDHYDVAVVGAGLIGCAAAHYLARAGRRVVVLDQSEINRGASGRNAGSLHFQIEPRMVDLLRLDPEKLAELFPVNLQAIEDWQQVASELRCDLEIVMHGGLMIAETEAEQELLLRKNALEVQAGLTVRIVERAELRRLAPYLSEQVRCASFCPQEGPRESAADRPGICRKCEGRRRGVSTQYKAAKPAAVDHGMAD